jgi:hypothetical protein
MIGIKFEYGPDSEIQRVKDTLGDLKWLNENKYRYSLPAFKNETEKVNDEEIKNSVKREYSSVEFKTAEEAVHSAWKEKWTKIEKIQNTIIGADKLDRIKVVFTRYGTSGSYRIPDRIVINLQGKIPEYLIKTVIHECIHLMIENLILKNKVTHWYKERIVNLIMNKEFESAFKMNDSPEYAKNIDAVFEEYYPDMISITKTAAELNGDENLKIL